MFDDDIVERDDGDVVVDWPAAVDAPDAPGVEEPVVEEPAEGEPLIDGLDPLAPDRSEAAPPRCVSVALGAVGEVALGADGEEEPAPELEPEPEPLVWAYAGATSKVVASR